MRALRTDLLGYDAYVPQPLSQEAVQAATLQCEPSRKPQTLLLQET